MADSSRIWVIDGGDKPELTSLGDPLKETPRPAPPARSRTPLRRLARPAPAPRPAPSAPARTRRPLHSAMLLALGYLLGPAGLLLTRRGRRSVVWTALAASWTVTAVALVSGWRLAAAGRGGEALVPWLSLGSALVVAGAFTLWARSLHLLLRGDHLGSATWSPRLTSPWAAVVLGLLAPGSGQALARRPGRAVATLWHAWPAVAAALALVQAPLIWSHRADFGPWGLDASAIEWGLLAATAVVALAPLLWLAQALEGGRLLAARNGRWQGGRGDWTVVALAATVAVALVVADPATIAAGLGEYADGLAARGCTVAPLALVRTAQRLDPGQPGYALQAADLYASAGATEAALRVRADLDRSLQPYLGALMREEQRTRAQAAPGNRVPDVGPLSAAVLLLPRATPADRASGPPRPVDAAPADSVP